MKEKLKKIAVVAAAMSPLAIMADDNVSNIPDIGVNMSSYLSEIGVKLGVTIGVGLGLAVAIWLIKKGWAIYKQITNKG